MLPIRAILNLCTAVLFAPAVPSQDAGAQIVVITSAKSTVSNLTFDELQRLYSAKSFTFDGHQAQIAEYPKVRRAFYKSLVKMSEDEMRRRWVAAVFRGETMLPTEIADASQLKQWVNEHPGSIAYIDAASVDASVKQLTLDNKKPTDPTYPLK